MVQKAEKNSLRKGDKLNVSGVIMVASGSLTLMLNDTPVFVIGAGYKYGYTESFIGYTNSYVIANEDSIVYRLSLEQVNFLLKNNKRFYEVAKEKLKKTVLNMSSVLFEKLNIYFVLKNAVDNSNIPYCINVTKISNVFGVSRRHIYRAIEKLEEEGYCYKGKCLYKKM